MLSYVTAAKPNINVVRSSQFIFFNTILHIFEAIVALSKFSYLTLKKILPQYIGHLLVECQSNL